MEVLLGDLGLAVQVVLAVRRAVAMAAEMTAAVLPKEEVATAAVTIVAARRAAAAATAVVAVATVAVAMAVATASGRRAILVGGTTADPRGETIMGDPPRSPGAPPRWTIAAPAAVAVRTGRVPERTAEIGPPRSPSRAVGLVVATAVVAVAATVVVTAVAATVMAAAAAATVMAAAVAAVTAAAAAAAAAIAVAVAAVAAAVLAAAETLLTRPAGARIVSVAVSG